MTATVSIVTCVSDSEAYQKNVVASLPDGDAERLPIDNAGNRYTAAQALNQGWERAAGDLIVFCHQDVVFPDRWLDRLREQVARVEQLAGGDWGVAGTFGRRGKQYYGHIDDPHGHRREGDTLPTAVETLDENCLVVSRRFPYRFDEELTGYHLYGVDLCLTARAHGLWNYALDCSLKHLSQGVKDDNYYVVRRDLERKWRWRRWRLGALRRIPAKMYGPSGPLHFGLRYAITR